MQPSCELYLARYIRLRTDQAEGTALDGSNRYFAETGEAPILQNGREKMRLMRITANGAPLLPGSDALPPFDVIADAEGGEIADIKVFKDITPAPDGYLHLFFQQWYGWGEEAFVNAIQIVPGIKGKLRPLRWRASETALIDSRGRQWESERFFQGGRLSSYETPVAGTADPDLYSGERFGNFNYVIPVASGHYTVRVHFAENFYGNYQAGRAGARVFNLLGDGITLLKGFDIFAEAGDHRLIVKTFRHLEPNAQGKLVLTFEPVTNYASVNAIEVEDEGN